MKQDKFLIIISFLAMFSVNNCFAAEFPNQTLGLTFNIPDTWKTDERDGNLTAFSPDERLIMAFSVATDEQGLNTWQAKVQQQITNLTGNGEQVQMSLSDGLVATVRKGRGELDEMGQVDIATFIIQSKNQMLLIVTAQTSQSASDYETEAENIFRSIRRLN